MSQNKGKQSSNAKQRVEEKPKGRREAQYDDHSNETEVAIKSKIPVVKKPEEKEHQDKIALLQATIEKLKAEVSKIDEQVGEKKGENNRTDQDEIRDRIKQINTKISALDKTKKDLQAEVDKAEDMRYEMKMKAQKLGSSLTFKKVDEIDRQIEKLENEITTTTMSLKEEKQLLTQIKHLKACKPAIIEYNEYNDKVVQSIQQTQELLEGIKEKQKEIRLYREQEQAEFTKLNELRSKNQATRDSKSTLLDQRKKLRDRIQQQYDQIKALRDEYRAANDAYYNYLRAVKDEKKKEMEARRAQQKAEREKRYAEKKQREAEEAEYKRLHPYDDEIEMCEILIPFLEGKLPGQKPARQQLPSSSNGPSKVGLPKKQDERRPLNNPKKEKMYILHNSLTFEAKGKNKGKKMVNLDAKPRQQRKPEEKKEENVEATTAATATTTEAEQQPEKTPEQKEQERLQKERALKQKKVIIPIERLAAFSTLGITAPQNVEQCEKALEDIKAKLVFFKNYKPEDKPVETKATEQPKQEEVKEEKEAETEENNDATANTSDETETQQEQQEEELVIE